MRRIETDWRKKSVSFKALFTRNCKIQRSIKTGTILCPAVIPDGGCFPNSDENKLFLSVYLSVKSVDHSKTAHGGLLSILFDLFARAIFKR